MPRITPKRLKMTPHPPHGAVLTATTETGRDYEINVGRSSIRGLGEALLRVAEKYEQEPRPVFPKDYSLTILADREADEQSQKLGPSQLRFETGVDETLSFVALSFFMRDQDDAKRVIRLDMLVEPADARALLANVSKMLEIAEAKPTGTSQ